MQQKNVVVDENPAAPAIEPEMLAQLKKEDMQQAVVERFRITGAGPRPKTRQH
jgi:hypothetical protein